MKIQFDKTGAEPIEPDFETLCAILAGVQAASPTALVDTVSSAPIGSRNTLVDLLAWPAAPADDIRGGASFNPAAARLEPGDEK